MRGAQPDAECPRCHHKQPPAETSLAHCGQCGLTFQPKELQVRTRAARRPPETALVVAQPTTLTIDEAGSVVTYRWSDNPGFGTFTSTLMAVVLGMLWLISDVPLPDRLLFTGVIALLAIGAHVQSRPTPRLLIDGKVIRGGGGTLALSEVTGIELDNGWIVARSRVDKPAVALVRPKDRAITAFLLEDIARRLKPDGELGE